MGLRAGERIEQLAINTIHTLSIDAVQAAKSGNHFMPEHLSNPTINRQ
jgi:transketolase